MVDHEGDRDDSGVLVGAMLEPGRSGADALDSTIAARREIARLRERLLGGRGPGASESETAPYMHDRATVGSLPTVIERELVRFRTQIARGDSAAVQHGVRRAGQDLADTLAELAAHLAPRHMADRAAQVIRSRFLVLLGAPAEAGNPLGGGRADESGAAAPDGRRFPDGTVSLADAREQWYWQVAVRSAVIGAVTATFALAILIRRPRRSARRPAGVLVPQHGTLSSGATGDPKNQPPGR